MNKKFVSVGVHWYSRESTLKESVELFVTFLKKLKQHNPELFSNWYEKAGSRKKALENKVVIDYEGVKKLFSKKKIDENSYPKVSFLAGMWNGGNDGETISINVSLGSKEVKYFTNHCVLELPYQGEGAKFYQIFDNQNQLINLLKEIWNPEWLVVDGVRM